MMERSRDEVDQSIVHGRKLVSTEQESKDEGQTQEAQTWRQKSGNQESWLVEGEKGKGD